MSLFLGLDIGTSAVKAIIVDADDREQASSKAPLSIDRPLPLWSEQIRMPGGLRRRGARPTRRRSSETDVRCRSDGPVGSNARRCLVDDAGPPIRPALLWNDGRSAAECVELERVCPDFADMAGARPMPGFSAPKILWLSRHEPDAMKRTRRILLTKDYVRLALRATRFPIARMLPRRC